jgi:lysophospholipase L1-like esterase
MRVRNLLLKGACSILVGLILTELLLRLFMPATPDYNQVINQSLESPERLYPANMNNAYDIHGLYDQASVVNLHISPNRFIEPEPPPAHYRVLFLGGSTTEAWFMQEAQRWVARLNVPGLIATYNAAQSGASTLDEYYTFRYLQDHGFSFDLVVLMTTVNDLTWQRRLTKYGAKFRIDDYRNGVKAWNLDQNPPSWLDNSRLVSLAKQLVAGFKAARQSAAQSWVLAYYLQQQHDSLTGKQPVGLDQCKTYADDVAQFEANERENLALLTKTVKATGAKFLVMSEATSFLAPSSSFKLDLRFAPDCGSQAVLTNQAAHELFTQLNRLYLQAAKDDGALTFDLAGRLDRYTNGPDGGRYIYDAAHFTADGAGLVAETLRPVLFEILMGDTAIL